MNMGRVCTDASSETEKERKALTTSEESTSKRNGEHLGPPSEYTLTQRIERENFRDTGDCTCCESDIEWEGLMKRVSCSA